MFFVPSSKEYNLVEMEAVRRVYRDAAPDIVIHLGARVGGLGLIAQIQGNSFTITL